MTHQARIAIVGAGIVGLAHAWSAAKRGHAVTLFERDDRALGASIRNFGMIWPIGLPAGHLHEVALRSRELWLELAEKAGIWVNPCGSIHLAYAADEMNVLREFAERAGPLGYECQALDAAEVLRRSPTANPDGLAGGLWSPTELCVDSPRAVAALPRWLHETYGVELQFGTAIVCVDPPWVRASNGRGWQADRVLVCSGADFRTLFPEIYAGSGLRRCKLQMLRTVPQPGGWRMGPHLAGGLTLRHYPCFRVCPSLGPLQQRIAAESAHLDRFGIHVMLAQNSDGEVIIGDSHEYDEAVTPFDKAEIDELILTECRKLARLPEPRIAHRWHGIYAKHPTEMQFIAQPTPGVTVIQSTGGLGMTMSFGLAEEFWQSAV